MLQTICAFPSGDPSEVTTVLLLPESQRSGPPCVALSLSLTVPEDGKWCQSIHQSNTGGGAERGAGGVVMAACRRSTAHDYGSLLQLFPLTAVLLMLQCLNGLTDCTPVGLQPQKIPAERPQWATMAICCQVGGSEGPHSQHLCVLHSLRLVLDHLGTQSPRLVRLKECAALIKDV